jgi:hypothetical protein
MKCHICNTDLSQTDCKHYNLNNNNMTTKTPTTAANATSLQAKILAVNTANQHTKQIYDFLTGQLKNLIGVNPLKVDGSFKAKHEIEKLHIEKQKISMFGFNWWIDTNYYLTPKYGYLTAEIKTCITGGGQDRNGVNRYCIYEYKNIDIVKIDENGIFCENDRPREDEPIYNEKEILQQAKEIKEAAEAYRAKANTFPYQFKDVLYIERLTR